MRLAWFTPWPPARSGIAAYSAELLPRLTAHAAIDVFLEDASRQPPAPSHEDHLRLWPAFDFQRLHWQAPYDVVVYQLGNARCHDYMWAYLAHYPGLVVLHDAQLHHARAAALIGAGRLHDYRAEFAFSHPDVPPAVAEFVVNGLQGSPYYLWPLRRVAVTAARTVAVHNAWLAAELREEAGETPVATIRMGTRDHDASRRAEVEGSPVFAAFGGVTPEKRIPQVIRAFADTLTAHPDARLVLVGETPPYYDGGADAQALGVAARVTVTGYVDEPALDAWLTRADVCLCLRWPTARETSASWLRCLAAGKPTVITDLAHLADVPSLDPRTWDLQHPAVTPARVQPTRGRDTAVAVAVDILDEDHSLALAMRRLAADAALRQALSAQARAWWERHHRLDHMVADYLAALEITRRAPRAAPARRTLPPHLLDSAEGTLKQVCEQMGVSPPWPVGGGLPQEPPMDGR